MSNRARKREQRRLEQQRSDQTRLEQLAREAGVQTSAPLSQHPFLDEIVAAPVAKFQATPPKPRKFGEARVYRLDSGLKVTIESDEETLEQEVFIRSESDFLEVLTGDAAIERRIAKQSGAVPQAAPTFAPAAPRLVPQPAGPAIAGKEPQFLGDSARAQGYNGLGPPPRDYQERVLQDVNLDFNAMAQSMGGSIAAIASAPEEVVAP